MNEAVLIITITDRNRGGEFAAWYQSQGIPLVLTALGRGTATTEILDYLGGHGKVRAAVHRAALPPAGASSGKGTVAGYPWPGRPDDSAAVQHWRSHGTGLFVAAGGARDYGE